MQPIPYLFFPGTCAEAMRAYARILGAPDPEIMTTGDLPEADRSGMEGVPADAVMHAALQVGTGWIFASDDPGGGTPAMAGVNIHLSFPARDEAARVFDALSEGGEVRMAFETTFWSPGFGALTDRFGIRWMISTDAPTP